MELIEYVRVKRGPRKGNLRGVVLANKAGIGWSFCRTTAQSKRRADGSVKVVPPDLFDKQLGLSIARARIDLPTNAKIPRDVEPVLARMTERRKIWLAGRRQPVAV